MLTDEQLSEHVRRSLRAASSELEPRADLRSRVEQDLARPPRAHTRWLGAVVPAAIALAVVALALVLIRPAHHAATRPGGPTSRGMAPAETRPGVFVPGSQSPWALLRIHVPGGRTCIGVTVLSTIHPPTAPGSLQTACAAPDPRGHAFLTRFAREVPIHFGAKQCGPNACKLSGFRNVGFGLLGPEAIKVTYRAADGHLVTERTGPDGAYLVIQPATRQTCVQMPGQGRECLTGSGSTASAALTASEIVRVDYRDGSVCRLPAPTGATVVDAGCPEVGIAPRAPTPYRPVHVSPGQVAAPVTAETVPATRYCAHNSTGVTIPCERSVPPGYTPQPRALRQHNILLNIRFTARVAADNNHTDYEYLVWPAGPIRCARGGELGASSTDPIRSGQRVLEQLSVATCPGRYTVLITYQPRVRHGVGLGPGLRIHDGSVFVGRTHVTLR